MSSKVFISWSGDLSRRIAEAIRDWLPGVLQFVKPYFTPNDIEKGARWTADISGELMDCDIGIICLTPENMTKPWILFEAGALSKKLDQSRVCTLAVNLDPSDIVGPLTLFQTTMFEKEDFRKLLSTVNASDPDNALERAVLDSVFEMWWPRLEDSVSNAIRESAKAPKSSSRTNREILEEVLELTRMNSRRVARGAKSYRVALYRFLDRVSRFFSSTAFRRDPRIRRFIEEDFLQAVERLSMELDAPEVFAEFMSMIEPRRTFQGELVSSSPDGPDESDSIHRDATVPRPGTRHG